MTPAGHSWRVTFCRVHGLANKFVLYNMERTNSYPSHRYEALYWYPTSPSPHECGVASRDAFYALPDPPRPPRPRPRSIAIARMYAVFLPSRRVLPSSLAGAVLAGGSVGSRGVE